MLAIRADMNAQIATGHVMRCLSIADALSQIGETVIFIVADKQPIKLIEERGFQCIVLGTDWNCKDEEIVILQNIIKKMKITKMLIDSYQVTQNYLEKISNSVRTMYIDDLNMFEYPVNIVVCYANYWERFYYDAKYSCKNFLLGTKYVPLRQAFWSCNKKKINEKADKLLLLSGGTDPYNFLGKILQKLKLESFEQIIAICGRYNTEYKKLCTRYNKYKNVKIYQSVSDIEKYMQDADIVVSAGGTTLYELCAVGTPTISYSFADNQLFNVQQFAQDGIIEYAGDFRFDNVIINAISLIEHYQNDYKLRKKSSVRMQKLVDGKGAERIAKILKNM